MDLNDILDEALDELDDEDEEVSDQIESKATTYSSSPTAIPPLSSPIKVESQDDSNGKTDSDDSKEPHQHSKSEAEESFQTMLMDFMGAQDDENDVDKQLQDFVQQVEEHFSPKSESPKKKQQIQQQQQKKVEETTSEPISSMDSDDIEKSFSKILQEMANAGLSDETSNKAGGPSEEDILKNLFGDFAAAAGSDSSSPFNADAVIDGMMEELMSKDLMYEPMKEVTKKFPEWLEKNKSKLSSEDYQGRCKQHEAFKKLVHVYETDPKNVTRLVDMVQQIQEFGNPPEEIIQEIAPGLELDSNGMPNINPLRGLGGNGDEECRIM